jgi:hypothetical protein
MGNIVAPLWGECPACTRLIVAGYPVLSIALFAVDQYNPMITALGFNCMLETVVDHYCVWTMLTAAFYRPFQGGMSFLMMLFELYMGMQMFPSREKDIGSTTFFLWVLLMNFSINVIFLLVMWLMSFSGGNSMQPNQGLWPLIFICITRRCLADPDGSTSFWGVVSIPNKWYSLCLLGFFCFLTQAIMWNLAAAVVIGYAYNHLRLEMALPSRVTIGGLEQRCCGANGRSCLGAYWIRAVDTAGYEVETGDRRYATLSDFGQSQQMMNRGSSASAPSSSSAPSGSPTTSFVAFAGSGNRLGDGEAEAEAMRPSEAAAHAAATRAAESARELGPTALHPSTASSGNASQGVDGV